MHPHRLVACPLPGLGGQRLQRRRVERSEAAGTATRPAVSSGVRRQPARGWARYARCTAFWLSTRTCCRGCAWCSCACTPTSSTWKEAQIAKIDQELCRQLTEGNLGQRLLTLPGIGPVTASVLAAEMGDGKQYGCARLRGLAGPGIAPVQHGRPGQPHGHQQARRQEPASAAGAVRQGLHAASGAQGAKRDGRQAEPAGQGIDQGIKGEVIVCLRCRGE